MSAALAPIHEHSASCEVLWNYLDSLQLNLEQGLSPRDRIACLLFLRECTYDFSLSSQLADILFEVLEKLCDWPLLIALQEKNILPNTPISLAENYYLMGNTQAAQHTLKKALLAQPHHQEVHYYWKSIQHICPPPLLADDELSLTPLAEHHMEAFAWQYEESIQDLCNLPHFNNNADWFQWHQSRVQDPHCQVFAVIHQHMGFMGCVSLQVYEGIGFFYYWLGEDFTGCGFGPRAVRLLLNYGYQYLSMDSCYAKVYQRNSRSHQAVKKLGFTVLPFQALPPYDDEVFYYLGEEEQQAIRFHNLQFLLYKMNSNLEVVPSTLQELVA